MEFESRMKVTWSEFSLSFPYLSESIHEIFGKSDLCPSTSVFSELALGSLPWNPLKLCHWMKYVM